MKLPGTLLSLFYFCRFIFFTLKERSARFLRYHPGHYSSPIPSWKQLQRRSARVFPTDKTDVAGVDINQEQQLQLLQQIYEYAEEFDFPAQASGSTRYHTENPMFGASDAYVLFAFLRKYQPQRYTEIGSGYSSSLVLDCRERWNTDSPALTFIEPYPVRLDRLLSASDRQHTEIIQKNVQDVPLAPFKKLEANDILFVDSSHLLRIDSDLSTILFHILPALNPGVLIHFHDIFWPFEYPPKILADGRLWNEAYLLQAFLQFNERFRILYFQSYLKSIRHEQMAKSVPAFGNRSGSSLWLVKLN